MGIYQNGLVKLLSNAALLLFISLLNLNVSAATYDLRKCSTQDQLCSTCEKLNAKVTPKINIKSSNVILNFKLPNKVDSQSLANCKIIDSDNWDCTEPFKSEPTGIPITKQDTTTWVATNYSKNGYKMVDGELIKLPYYQTQIIFSNGRHTFRRISEPDYLCIIKDSFFNFLKW